MNATSSHWARAPDRYALGQPHATSPSFPGLMARVAGLFKLPQHLALQWATGQAEPAGTTVRQANHDAQARCKDAAQVRAYALRVRAFDPSFAADLLAAADRHEATEGPAA